MQDKTYKLTHAFVLARYLIYLGISTDNDTLAEFMEMAYDVPVMIVDTFNPVNDNLEFIRKEYNVRSRKVLE